MADTFDDVEKRQGNFRPNWTGNAPAPGTSAFGAQAKVRQDRLRQANVSNTFPVQVTKQAPVPEAQGAIPTEKKRVIESEDILKKAGE